MQIVTPTLPSHRQFCAEHLVIVGADQPEYIAFHGILGTGQEGTITLRVKFSFWERIKILLFGSIWIQQLTFGGFGPLKFHVKEPAPSECL